MYIFVCRWMVVYGQVCSWGVCACRWRWEGILPEDSGHQKAVGQISEGKEETTYETRIRSAVHVYCTWLHTSPYNYTYISRPTCIYTCERFCHRLSIVLRVTEPLKPVSLLYQQQQHTLGFRQWIWDLSTVIKHDYIVIHHTFIYSITCPYDEFWSLKSLMCSNSVVHMDFIGVWYTRSIIDGLQNGGTL